MPSAKEWLHWARGGDDFRSMLDLFPLKAEEAEALAQALTREMEGEEEDREGVAERTRSLMLLLERQLLTAKGAAARTLVRMLDGELRERAGGVQAAEKLLLLFPDLAEEDLSRLVTRASMRGEIWPQAMRHPAAGPALWRRAVEKFSSLATLVPVLAGIPEARALPEVEEYLLRSTRANPRYLRYTAEMFEGAEFSELFGQMVAISPYQAATLLSGLPPSPRRPVRSEHLMPLLSSERETTRELGIRLVQHLASSPVSPGAAQPLPPVGTRQQR